MVLRQEVSHRSRMTGVLLSSHPLSAEMKHPVFFFFLLSSASQLISGRFHLHLSWCHSSSFLCLLVFGNLGFSTLIVDQNRSFLFWLCSFSLMKLSSSAYIKLIEIDENGCIALKMHLNLSRCVHHTASAIMETVISL